MKYTFYENKLLLDPEGKYTNRKIRNFLDDYLQSKKNRYLLIQNKQILLDDIPVKHEDEIIGKKTITLLLPDGQIDWIPATQECHVIYEDPFIYVVHKEAGIIIHGEPDDADCLNAYASRYQMNHKIQAPVRPIHRLDKETTGLMIYSKIPFFQPWFDHQLSSKKIRRHYLAICSGNTEPNFHMTINKRIGRDRHHAGMYRISASGNSAVTKVKAIANYKSYCLFDCTLETGRTHQIRVHLASIGYPIINDPLYGRYTKDFDQMGLWAYKIEFKNPITHKKHKIYDTDQAMYQAFKK